MQATEQATAERHLTELNKLHVLLVKIAVDACEKLDLGKDLFNEAVAMQHVKYFVQVTAVLKAYAVDVKLAGSLDVMAPAKVIAFAEMAHGVSEADPAGAKLTAGMTYLVQLLQQADHDYGDLLGAPDWAMNLRQDMCIILVKSV